MIFNLSGGAQSAAGGAPRSVTINSASLPSPSAPYRCIASGLSFRPRYIVSKSTYPDMIHIGEADIVMVVCYMDGVNTHPDEYTWTITDDGFEFYDTGEAREAETVFYVSE